MLEHQYYALAACLVLFAAALAYSAKSAREYHIWYKKEKEEAKARDLLKKMQSTGEAPLDLGTGDGKTESLSEERAVARKAARLPNLLKTVPVPGQRRIQQSQ